MIKIESKQDFTDSKSGKKIMEQTNQKNRNHKLFGRPPLANEEKRTIKISIFLTEWEAEQIKEKCKETYLTIPEFIRRTALSRHIEKRKSEFDLGALKQLRGCGLTLFQLKRELFLAREKNLQVDFAMIENALEKQLTSLKKISKKIIEE